MQRMTTYFMPLMLFVFSFNFPAGLVLYWTISNIFEIVRMGVTVSWDPLKPENLFSGLLGSPTVAAARPAQNTAPKRATARQDDSDDESDEPVNPPPGRPPGGARKKKGKRGGKR
jgi:hypothetical protein